MTPESWDEVSDPRRFWWLLPPVLFALLTFAIVKIAGGPSDPPNAEDTARQTFVTGPSPVVNIDSIGGDIRVTAHDRQEVVINVRRQGFGTSNDTAFDNLANLTLRMVQEGNEVFAIASDQSQQAEPGAMAATFEVTVPREASLVLQTAGGAIRITGVAGEISATTARGSIEVVLAYGSSFRVTVRAAEFTTNFPLQLERAEDPEVTAGYVGLGDQVVETVAPGGAVVVRYE